MAKERSHPGIVCSRCGTRADARRGASPMCLSCGNPFPTGPFVAGTPVPGSAAAAKGSPLLWVLVTLLAVVCCGLIAAVAVLAARAPATAAAPVGPEAAAPVLAAVGSTAPADASAPDASAPPPLTAEELDELAGNYTCKMDDTPAFPCRVSNNTLEKLAGSQRFRGPVKKLANGNIEFSGTFFCPFGDCTHPVATTFVRQGPGRYIGKFGPNSVPGGGPGGERVVLNKVR